MFFPGWITTKTFPQDASPRCYYRAEKGGRSAIIMDAQKLDRQEFQDFIAVGTWLRSIGLRAPEIYEADMAKQILLLEDFGDLSMKQALVNGADARDLYAKAKSILGHLAQHKCNLTLPNYTETRVHDWRRLVMDYYLPAATKKSYAPELLQKFLQVWDAIEKTVPPCPRGFLHMDFHVENLMVLPDGTLGILDFQTAAIGPLGYDLGNLAFDMRYDVPPAIAQFLLKDADPAQRSWVRILATQFHGRLLGQCIRWSLKDNKPQYLQYIPRLEAYMRAGLQDPLLQPLKRFFDDLGLDFRGLGAIETNAVQSFICADAP